MTRSTGCPCCGNDTLELKAVWAVPSWLSALVYANHQYVIRCTSCGALVGRVREATEVEPQPPRPAVGRKAA